MATKTSSSDAPAADISASMDSDAAAESPLDEYETQYFGFTPKSFCNGFYNAVNEYFMDSLKILEQSLQKSTDAVLTSQVEQGVATIKQLLAQHIDRAFDTLETYLFTNIFCIPPHVLLPEDQVHRAAQEDQVHRAVQEGPEELARLDKSIQEVKDKIMAVKYANAVLQTEVLEGKKVQGTLTSVVEEFQQMQDQLLAAGVANVRDYSAHSLTQAEKLLHLMGATSKLLRCQAEEEDATEPKAKMPKPS